MWDSKPNGSQEMDSVINKNLFNNTKKNHRKGGREEGRRKEGRENMIMLSSLIMVPEVFVCFFYFYFYLSPQMLWEKKQEKIKKNEWPTCDRAVETPQCSALLVIWSLWAPSSLLSSHKLTQDSLISPVSFGLFEEKKQDNISSVTTEFELLCKRLKT